MRLFNHHFLRIFIALLATVFITNTVYAGSMMVSASFNSHTLNMSLQPQAEFAHGEEHLCHDHDSSDQHHDAGDALINHQPQVPSHGSCSDCNHCMACYSMMPGDQVNVASGSSKPVLAIAMHVLYLAPTNSQPNKPPIS